MGKPSPAKLANFPEIEVFVMVAEPQGLILDSKEFLAPIITPHEALLAMTGQAFEAGSYRLDYGGLLEWYREECCTSDGQLAGPSRAGGGRYGGTEEEVAMEEEEEAEEDQDASLSGGGALVAMGGGLQVGAASSGGQQQRQLTVRSAAEYLATARTFKGLETPATGAEIKAAEPIVQGRSGRAAGYVDEPRD